MSLSKASGPRSGRARSSSPRSEGCPVGALFAMLGQPHMLQVLHLFLDPETRSIRFGALQRQLELSPRTLSNRLKALVESGLLVRHRYSEIPPRVEYEATEKARQLGDLFRTMEAWASHNTLTAVRTVSVVGRA